MENLNKILISAVVLFSFFCGFYVTHNHYVGKINEIEKKQLQKDVETVNRVNKINEEKIVLEKSLKEQEQESYEKIKKLKDTNNIISNDVANYKRRLFVKIRSGGEACLSENTTSTLSNGETRTAELDSTTSKQLIAITAKADSYKQQLEELQNYINKYNENVDILNKKIDTKY